MVRIVSEKPSVPGGAAIGVRPDGGGDAQVCPITSHANGSPRSTRFVAGNHAHDESRAPRTPDTPSIPSRPVGGSQPVFWRSSGCERGSLLAVLDTRHSTSAFRRRYDQAVTLVAVLTVISAVGCASPSAPSAEEPTRSIPAAVEVPVDRDGILRRLAPLPHASIIVVYDVEGPANLRGTMELLAAPGGYRRENWSITLDMNADDAGDANEHDRIEIRTTVIETPDALWRASDGTAGRRQPRHLGALAQAYLELDGETRRRVASTLDRWQADLAAARREHPGPRDTVLGVGCLDLEIAGQRVCLWEAADIALRHEGDGLRLLGRSIETDTELGAHAFLIPDDDESPDDDHNPNADAIDAREQMRRLADGRYASLALRRFSTP